MKLTKKTIWASNSGDIEVQEMEDEHILNTIAFLQRRGDEIRRAAADTRHSKLTAKYVNARLAEYQEWKEVFFKELARRQKHGITIERRY